MGDILKYRLPNQSQIEQREGIFEPFEHLEFVEGFVLASFEPGRSFRFIEQKTAAPTYHFGANKPHLISFREYILETQGILNSFDAYQLEKVVYSRVKAVAMGKRSLDSVFEDLCSAYPNAFVYLISSPLFGTWMGATPEILIHREGNHLFTIALAGTKRSNDKSEWGEKEKHEQQVVSEYIVDTLKEHGAMDLELIGPYTHPAGPVQHLKTDISCSLGQANFEEIVTELHPTPAVCGIPKDTAASIIGQREIHERDFYTGFIGLKEKNTARLFVNLRCAQIIENKAYLYLGGGLTRGSIPELEWEETEHKALTLEEIFRRD